MNSFYKKIPFGLTKSSFLAIAFLIIIYAVGIVGIGVFKSQSVLSLTPINLLISLGVILAFHEGSWRKILLVIAVCFSFGLLVEIIGVQTGIVFGDYQYGPVLGFKIWNTPVMIGVNWALLVYAIGSSINLFVPNRNSLIKAAIGALFMVLLDILIEPVAIALDFWNWSGIIVPIQNYVAWGFISFLLLFLFFSSFKTESNKVAYALFILQGVFFGALNLLLNI